MNGPERSAVKTEPARSVIEAAQLAVHVERLLRNGETLSPFCELCQQAAAELGVSLPLPSSS